MLYFETAGYKAPFEFVFMFEIPSTSLLESNPTAYYAIMRDMPCPCGTCAVCGTGIIYNFIVRDGTGKLFATGCECIKKIDRTMYDSAIKAKRNHMIQKLAAKKSALTRARHDAERLKNGGLTDAEVAQQANLAAYEQKKLEFMATNKELFDAATATQNDFALHVLSNAMEWLSISEKQVKILEKIIREYDKKKNALNEYSGTVGDKMELMLTNDFELPIASVYGTTWLIILSDEAGRTYKYFGKSKAIPSKYQSGIVRFTVKGHDEHNGVKQTAIIRPTTPK